MTMSTQDSIGFGRGRPVISAVGAKAVPPELAGLPVPEPGEGQLLIRVNAAGRQSRAPSS
jgi:hypothetical protein